MLFLAICTDYLYNSRDEKFSSHLMRHDYFEALLIKSNVYQSVLFDLIISNITLTVQRKNWVDPDSNYPSQIVIIYLIS